MRLIGNISPEPAEQTPPREPPLEALRSEPPCCPRCGGPLTVFLFAPGVEPGLHLVHSKPPIPLDSS